MSEYFILVQKLGFWISLFLLFTNLRAVSLAIFFYCSLHNCQRVRLNFGLIPRKLSNSETKTQGRIKSTSSPFQILILEFYLQNIMSACKEEMPVYYHILAVTLKEQVFLILTAMVCLVSVTRTVTREPTVILLLSSSSKTSVKRKATHILNFFKAFFSINHCFCLNISIKIPAILTKENFKIFKNKSPTTSNILSGWGLLIQQTIKQQHWVWNFNCMKVRKFKVIAAVGTITL